MKTSEETQLSLDWPRYARSRIKVKTGGKKRARENPKGKGAEDPQEEEEEEERGGEAAMKKLLASLPSDLRVVTNFGLVDICPLRSGKHNAAAFLAREHFDIPLANCASMGDDDNDIALVSAEERVFRSAVLCCFHGPLSLRRGRPLRLFWVPAQRSQSPGAGADTATASDLATTSVVAFERETGTTNIELWVWLVYPVVVDEAIPAKSALSCFSW